MDSSKASQPFSARLSLWDTTSLIVGVIVGAGIYQTPSLIFQNTAGPWEAMGVWILGGVLSLMGALCFAELAAAYPRSGGDYVYLTRAYGSWVGFFFAWGQLAVIRTGGGIAAVAYVFAEYANTFTNSGPAGIIGYGVAAIAVLSLINILGVNPGKRTQNLLTVAKVLGLAAIIVVGFAWTGTPAPQPPAPKAAVGAGSFALALLFVFYTYDGWNEAVYVAGEVHNWRRNMPLALILGTLAVTVLYVLINLAYLAGLGFAGAAASNAIAADVLSRPLGELGARAISVLVMISVLGAIHGTIFAGSRIYSAMGADHRVFAPLGRWHPQLGTPVCSLVTQAVISIAMVIVVGLVGILRGRQDGFDVLLKYTSGVFWLFFLLTGLSLLVLRWRDRATERPFRVPGYPVVPLLFCGWCGYMLYGTIRYAPMQSLAGLGILLAGLPLYLFSRRPRLAHPPLSGPHEQWAVGSGQWAVQRQESGLH